jgi:hypothetical protein
MIPRTKRSAGTDDFGSPHAHAATEGGGGADPRGAPRLGRCPRPLGILCQKKPKVIVCCVRRAMSAKPLRCR